ncbi:hypothetical protein WJX72_000234 [[Myrmecia] bisecta]|uniref:Steroid 5-alpha reductase C-terminal domain-containing protein n=1 Tax=[Myrmecia] bisecta TaxID=41462 RepID=A0AAW1R5D0_9CHLO
MSLMMVVDVLLTLEFSEAGLADRAAKDATSGGPVFQRLTTSAACQSAILDLQPVRAALAWRVADKEYAGHRLFWQWNLNLGSEAHITYQAVLERVCKARLDTCKSVSVRRTLKTSTVQAASELGLAATAVDAAAVRPFLGTMWTAVGHSLMASGAIIAAMNTVGFLATAVTKSHKLTDLTGTTAFIASAWTTHIINCKAHGLQLLAPSKSLLLAGCVTLWGVRLAGYLFYRVLVTGEDKRLRVFFPRDDKEPYLTGPSMFPLKLAGFWTAQSLWAWVGVLPVTVAQAVAPNAALGLVGTAALGALLVGFAWETVADVQKYVFKSKPENKDRFISEGLYRYSRHPNYFGEILFWSSMYVLAGQPAIWRAHPWIVASPLFTAFLLLFASGVPPLEASHNKRYGSDPHYQAYKASTNKLIPWFPCKASKAC